MQNSILVSGNGKRSIAPGKGKKAKARRMTQAERTELSDARMYDVATHLICELGAHNTTLKDIGERAGFSRGLASQRFGSKDVLFGNLVAQFNRRWASELARFVGDRTGLQAFLAALEAVEHFLVAQPTYMRAMYILWYESISTHNEVRIRLAHHHMVYRSDVQRWIEESIAEGSVRPDIIPAQISVQFCSFIFGTIYQWLVNPEAIDVPATFKQYRRSILKAITEEHTPPARSPQKRRSKSR